MNSKPSIARGLALRLTVGASVIWLLSVGIASVVLRYELNESFDKAMYQFALRLIPLASYELGDRSEDARSDEVKLEDSSVSEGANLNYYIMNRAGRILLSSGERPHKPVVLPGFSVQDDSRVFSLQDPETHLDFVVTEHLDVRNHVWKESVLTMLVPLTALIPLFAILVFWIVRVALTPVKHLSEAIAARHGRNMSPLELGLQPVELQPILDEVDSLLTRLTAAMEAERNFAAESAHELRTPIAGALAQLQVLESRLTDPEHRKHLAQSEKSLRNLAHLAENLLQVSRLEAGFSRSEDLTNLSPIVDLVLTEPAFQSESSRFRISKQPLAAFIMPDAFAIVLRNLLQNALLYSDPGTFIELDIRADGFEVRNQCEPVSPDVLPKLSQRFVRGQTGLKGTGLGLSIVSAIVADSEGVLTIHSPIPGSDKGFAVSVSWCR
jgi:two-component system OmpR family sensor kinase